MSTSEFQRVKSYLMKATNAKAGITTDYDQTDDSKPTLKKRQPDPVDSTGSSDSSDSTGSDSSSSSTSDGPPKLKKRGQPDETAPAASPSPGP